MKQTIGTETHDTKSSSETGNVIANTLGRISSYKVENSSSVFITFEESGRQLKAVTDPLTHKLTHFCELMHELKSNRFHERPPHSRLVAQSQVGAAGLTSNTCSYFR